MPINKRALLTKRLDICSAIVGAVGIALSMVGLHLHWGWIVRMHYLQEILISVRGIQTSGNLLVFISCIVAVFGFFLMLTKVLKIAAALMGSSGVCIVFMTCSQILGDAYVPVDYSYERVSIELFSIGTSTTLIGGLMIIAAAALSVIHVRRIMAEEKKT